MRFPKYASVPLLLACTFLGVSSGQTPAPPAAAPPTAAAPAPPSAPPSAAVAALQNDLRAAIRAPGWSSARYGVLVVSLDRGDTIFAMNPDLALAPASNMKLYTTAAALYYLGPEFRFSTYVLGDGEVRDSTLLGDVVLYGTGDPAISARMLPGSTATLEALADSLRARGIREIRGDVVGDGSYFDDVRIGSAWNPRDLMAWYAAPISALSFAENMISVRILPGGGTGQPARVVTSPDTRGLLITNNIQTVGSGGTRVQFEHGPRGLVLSGRIRRGHPGIARSIPVVDPAQYSAAAFRAALEARGIRVTGTVRTVAAPSGSPVTLASRTVVTPASGDSAAAPPRVLTVHLSPTLGEIIRVTNVRSHNLFAEALFKLVGRVALGDGSFDGGERAIRYMLECEIGVDTTAFQLDDGSGLSRTSLVSARNTIRLLDFMEDSEMWDTYWASLPEAADPDGLRRMERSAAAGNLRAKTGTIRNVSALSGYVTAANGERLAFSIMANNVPSTWRAKRTEDAIGARIAAFTRPPPPEPQPPADTAAVEDRDSLPSPARAGTDTVGTDTVDAPVEAPPETPAPEPPTTRTHTVRSGETLDGIARRYGITVRELQDANPGVDPRRLQLGQDLVVPGAGTQPPTEPRSRTHRIRPGDTLDGIARRNDITVNELRAANPGIDPRRLQPGQEITIPE